MSFPETIVLHYGEVKSTSTTQRCPLGTRGALPDGRIFRYAKAGAAIKLAWLVQADAAANIDDFWSYSSSGTAVHQQLAAGTTHTSTWDHIEVETSWITQGDTLMAEDYFAEGYIWCGSSAEFQTATGQGQIVRIKSHAGTTVGSTEHTKFYLEDGDHLVEELSTDKCIGIMLNPYSTVINVAQAASPTAATLGVPLCAVASGSYFWLQTYGPCVLGAGNAIAAGAAVTPTTDAADSGISFAVFTSVSGGNAPLIGYAMLPALVDQYCMVMLQIAP